MRPQRWDVLMLVPIERGGRRGGEGRGDGSLLPESTSSAAPYLASIFSASAVNKTRPRRVLPEAELTSLFVVWLFSTTFGALRARSSPNPPHKAVRSLPHSCLHFRRKRSLFEKIIRRYHVNRGRGRAARRGAAAAFLIRRILRAPLLSFHLLSLSSRCFHSSDAVQFSLIG